MFYCYKITNTINSKVYIGITSDIKKRWREHKCTSKTSGKPLYRAIRKYGLSKFTIFELCSMTDWEAIAQYEIDTIAKHQSTDMSKGYNLSEGGEGAYGVKRTKAQIEAQKLRASKWSQENIKYLTDCAKKQMSDPKNRELSRQGAIKQWNQMSDNEKEIRSNRMSDENKIRWKNKSYIKTLMKSICKPVIGNGVKYKSVTDCAKANNVAPNTMTLRCKNPKNKEFYYIKQ